MGTKDAFGLLKTKEEVIDYLNNIGVEYRYGCYENKNPEACELLGEFFELIEQNIQRAGKLYRFTCDQYSLGKSCHNYASFLFYGRGVNKDYVKALDYFSKGCLQGHASSCFNAAQIHLGEHKEVRRLIPRDIPKSYTLFEKGCLLNNPDSCSLATYLNYSGFVGTKQPDYDKAFKTAERGCALNELNCCVYLTKAYKEGMGCEKNEEKFKETVEKVKDIGEQFKKSKRTLEMQRFT